MNDAALWTPLLLTAGLLIALFEAWRAGSSIARMLGAGFCGLITVRYAVWRTLFTHPGSGNLVQQLWSYVFLVAELASLLSTLLVYFFMSRTIDRTPEATAHGNSAVYDLPADVFVTTYNESRDILERTMVGALAVQHSDLRVWILDDGNREWVRELADALGVRYVSRIRGKHAKAGNINNGLKHAFESDRPPAFFLLLDADFVPHRNILRRTLGLFDNPSVGIVQTPQHFFNPDPIQSNLVCSAVWPDEQRFFFNSLLPSKDAWGAAFCCGTSAVFRADAFRAAGGMAIETVTEDMLTTFKFEEFGYRTVFLNERLSLGLAPESLVEFITQRSRWCLGAIQQLFTRWSFTGRARISLINRLAFFDSVLFWITGATFKLMIVTAPLLYWFTGTSVIHADGADLIRYLAPMLLANLLFMGYLAENRVFPVMTDLSQLLSAIVIVRTVVSGLVRPFGRPFKVTAKGLSSSAVTVQWKLLWPYLSTALLIAVGVAVHVGSFSRSHGARGYTANVVWSLMDVVLLFLAALICVEPPRHRRDERFKTTESGLLTFSSASSDQLQSDLATSKVELPCVLQDISLGGAALCLESAGRPAGPAHLLIRSAADETNLSLPVQILHWNDGKARVRFKEEPWVRPALIRKLFTGDYHSEVQRVSPTGVLTSILRALVS